MKKSFLFLFITFIFISCNRNECDWIEIMPAKINSKQFSLLDSLFSTGENSSTNHVINFMYSHNKVYLRDSIDSYAIIVNIIQNNIELEQLTIYAQEPIALPIFDFTKYFILGIEHDWSTYQLQSFHLKYRYEQNKPQARIEIETTPADTIKDCSILWQVYPRKYLKYCLDNDGNMLITDYAIRMNKD